MVLFLAMYIATDFPIDVLCKYIDLVETVTVVLLSVSDFIYTL